MAAEITTGKTIGIVAVILIAFYAILIWTGQAKNPFSKDAKTGGREGDTGNRDGDLKCELRGSNGQIITITGRGPEFERMCRQQTPVNLWGYQWYPLYYYYWWPNWGWTIGRQPSGGHGSGTGGGTGGGGGTGTGAGTGTPGTGTP